MSNSTAGGPSVDKGEQRPTDVQIPRREIIGASEHGSGGAWLTTLERTALPLLVVGLFLVFTLLPATQDSFPTVVNLRTLAANQSVIAIVAIAAMIPLIVGEFDVSVGANLGMGQIAAAGAMANAHVSAAVAILIAIAMCAFVGVVNGYLVAYVGVNSLITTLGMGTFIGGLVLYYSHSAAIVSGIAPSITDFGLGLTLGVPNAVWVVAVAALLVGWLLRQTPFGRYLLAVGSSPNAAHLVGLPVKRLVFCTFVMSGALAGVAGVILLARTGSAIPSVGSGYTLPAFAAAFLGATSITPGRFNVIGTLVGVLFVAVSVNGLTLAGTADWVDPVFNGAALVIAVALSTLVGKHRRTH
jgi:ribose transport system permease protein